MERDRDTRATMLEAAIRVIESGGTEAIRVRDVAAAAGVSYASLYHYFGDREGLIEAAQVERYARSAHDLLARFGDQLADCTTRAQFRKVLVRFVRRTYEPDRWRHRMDRVSVLGTAQSHPSLLLRLAEVHRERERRLAAAFCTAGEQGWLRGDVAVDELASWVVSLLSARVFVEIDPQRAGSEAWNRLTEQAILAAVLGEPAGIAGSAASA